MATDQVEDRGEDFEVLIKFSRGGGRSADPAELVLQRKWFEGHEFLDLRVFDLATGRPRPTSKGTSIRIREARALAEAILRAVPEGDGEAPPTSAPSPRPERPSGAPRRVQRQDAPLLRPKAPATAPVDPDDAPF